MLEQYGGVGHRRVPYLPVTGAQTEVTVIGAGAAGLYTALRAARLAGRVTLISASPIAESSSYWAQGGLAAALAHDDSPDRHLADTLAAGRGSVRESAARVLCTRHRPWSMTWPGSGSSSTSTIRGAWPSASRAATRIRRVVHAGGAETGRRADPPALGPGRRATSTST